MAKTQLIECDKCDETVKAATMPEGWADVTVEIVEPTNVRQRISDDDGDEERDDPYNNELVFCPSCTQELLRKSLGKVRR